MLFTIIIPVYNRAQVMLPTLQSVLEQTHRPLQLVLVDNASDDDTWQRMQQFALQHDTPDFSVELVQEPRRMAGAARNAGARRARGQWLMFFDSDDLMRPTLVEAYARMAAQCPLDVISTRALLLFPDGDRREAPFFTHDIMANQILHSQLATQRYAVSRDFFAQTDGWDETLPGWNDWELAIRLLLRLPRLGFLSDEARVLINHSRPDSITGTEFHTRAGHWERALDLAQEHVRRAAPARQVRYGRLIDYRRLMLAAHYQREGCPELARPLARQAMDNLRDSYGNNWSWRCCVALVARRLYSRIVAGRRGSARVARILF